MLQTTDNQTRAVKDPAVILVVDDELDIRELLTEMLESAGYLVLTAGNGIDALHRLVSNAVDLVIIDLVMPEQEGIETIRILNRDRPGLKIIAMSGSFGPCLDVARLLGAHDSLQKPFRLDGLLKKVSLLLANSQPAPA